MTEESRHEADKCIELAHYHIATGKIDKAERLALKAQRLFPSDRVTQLLEKIRIEKQFSERSKGKDSMYSKSSTLSNQEDAERCIEVAQTAILAGQLDKARRMLKKSERLCPSNRAKDLLRQIDNEGDSQNLMNLLNRNSKPVEVEKPVDKPKRETTTGQIHAMERVNKAKNSDEVLEISISSSNFDEAKKFSERDERMQETAAAKNLLDYIRMTAKVNIEKDEVVEKSKTEVGKITEQETNNDYSQPDANMVKRNGSSSRVQEKFTEGKKRRAGLYLQQAQEAYKAGNFQEAEKLAQKVQRVCQSTEAENFLTIVHSNSSRGPEKKDDIRMTEVTKLAAKKSAEARDAKTREQHLQPKENEEIVNATLDDIMMDSVYDGLPKIDTETELVVNLALSNKNRGFLDDIYPMKVKNFDEVKININTQFKLSGDCLIVNKLEDADACWTKAEMAFVDLCPEKPIKKKTGNNMSNVKPANYEPSDRDALTVRGDNEDVVKCLRIAEKAIALSNFDKAKKFLEKAERIKETAAAKKLLECIRMTEVAKLAAKESAEARDAKIQKQHLQPKVNLENDEVVEKSKIEIGKITEIETNNDYSRPDANTLKRNASCSHVQEASTEGKKRRAGVCLQQAQEAYKAGNFQEAEKIAQKAQRVCQSTEAENFLTIVHSEISNEAEKKDFDSTKNNQQPHHKKTNTVEAHLQKAIDYMKSGHLDEAEKELKSAQKLDLTMDVDEVAATLRIASRSSTDDTTHSYLKGAKNNNSRVEKDYLINREIAETAMKEKSFIKADKFFKMCYGLKRTKSVEDILKNLQIEIFEAQNVENTSANMDKIKDVNNSFIDYLINREIAETAMKEKSFIKADKFFKMCYGLKRTKSVERILNNLQIEIFEAQNVENTSADTDKIKDNNSDVNSSFIENVCDANKYLHAAINALKRNNLDDAEKLAMKSHDLLGKIINSKAKNDTYGSCGTHPNSPKKKLTGHEANKIDNQFDLLKKADELLEKGQLEEAKNLAYQAKEFGRCEHAETLLLRISKLNQLCNKKNAQTSIHVAESAIKENHVQKAEDFHNTFDRYPTERVKALELIQMSKLGNETRKQKTIERTQENLATRSNSTARKLSESSEDTSNTVIEKFIDIAKNAISSEDFPRAKKFLEKAQRTKPTDKAQSLLKDIQQRMQNKTKAEKLVAYAIEAISDEDYDFAEMLLTNARIKYKSVSAKQLLDQVKRTVSQAELVEQKIQKTKKPICKNNLGTTEKQQKYAEKYFKLAEKMEMEGSLEDSEVVLIIAQNTYPQNYAAKLLTEVRNKLYARSPKWKSEYEWKFPKSAKQGIVSSEAYKCYCYVQMAERAHSVGNMNVAEDFLLVADSLCPSSHTKHLLKQVEKVKSFSAGPRKPSK